jgi:3-oxoacyl-[acyl-carrier protein] reductase
MFDFKNKVAIVTGASRGIGAAIAEQLARGGARVAFTYAPGEPEPAEQILKLKSLGQEILCFQSDVKSFAAAQNLVAAVAAQWKQIDILVNNAGINRDQVIWKMSEEDWDSVIDTDLKGYFNFMRAVVPFMREKNYGRIINISSINGLRGKFGSGNYSAAKAGVIGLTKSCAKEVGKFNITVNAVAPGLIETEMVRKLPAESIEHAMREIVLGKIGQPEDVANTASFLASDYAKHITGEVIKVDGGQYI